MKRYLAFYGRRYYPLWGMEDFIGDFDTEIEAKAAVMDKHSEYTLEDKDDEFEWNWFQIWDSETKLIVDKSE